MKLFYCIAIPAVIFAIIVGAVITQPVPNSDIEPVIPAQSDSVVITVGPGPEKSIDNNIAPAQPETFITNDGKMKITVNGNSFQITVMPDPKCVTQKETATY